MMNRALTVCASSTLSLSFSSSIPNLTAKSRLGSAMIGYGKLPIISGQYDLISFTQSTWHLRSSTEWANTFTLRLAKWSLCTAIRPSSVVHTGVKSAG
uniref:Putative secreted protein n=1 Tax=Anopheles triannulatus TaxID=58253 RepID=A0A2M4B482_9DIPT